jgi:DnaJ-class molecular chaperone
MGDQGEDDQDTVEMEPVWLTCPACGGSGQMSAADARPCPLCAGSGKIRGEVAEDLAGSGEMEAGPGDDG